jgi:hypothetical protein
LANLAPATMLIGFGQAFIVSCFFRIGLSDVPAEQAGAGSAMLTTVQQASFGLGSALLGGVFAQTLQPQGDHRHAALSTLAVEWGLMLILVGACVVYGRQRAPVSTPAAAPQEG